MYTNLDDVYGKRQLSAEGVTLSGVLDTKLYMDTTLESLVKSSAEGARKYFRISQAKGQSRWG